MRKPRLKLVQSNPKPGLERFRTRRSFEAGPEVLTRRRPPRRMTEKFVRIPHAWGQRLHEHRVNGAAWYLLCALDQFIHEPGKGNPVKLSARTLKAIGLGYWEAYRALPQLEKAGAVVVTRRPGRALMVDLVWYWTRAKKVTQNSKGGLAK